MRRQCWTAYGLIGLFQVLYLVSFMLPGLVFNTFTEGRGGYSVSAAVAALEQGRPCWFGDQQLHVSKDHALADAHGGTIPHQASIVCRDPQKQNVWQGYQVLLMGWIGPVIGILAWYANVLALLAMIVAIIGRAPKTAAWVAFGAVVIGLDAFRFEGLPNINVPGNTLDHLGSGYYVWETSMVMLLLSQIVTLRDRRA